jgi:hypothetical protein
VRACCETAGFFDGVVDHCEAQLGKDADEYRASISQGRLSIDDDALASCADHVRMAYLGCGWRPAETMAGFSDCVDGIRGAVPIGEACSFTEECVGAGNGRVKCRDGSCVDHPLADGERCESDDDCGSTSYCADTCRPAKSGSSCASDAECGGLYCNPTLRTCVSLPGRSDCQG